MLFKRTLCPLYGKFIRWNKTWRHDGRDMALLWANKQ